MFQDELAQALKYIVADEMSEDYWEYIEECQSREEEEDLVEKLIKRAKVNLNAEDGVILKVDDGPEYVSVDKDKLNMRVQEGVGYGGLLEILRSLKFDKSEVEFYDVEEQDDGTAIYKFKLIV